MTGAKAGGPNSMTTTWPANSQCRDILCARAPRRVDIQPVGLQTPLFRASDAHAPIIRCTSGHRKPAFSPRHLLNLSTT